MILDFFGLRNLGFVEGLVWIILGYSRLLFGIFFFAGFHLPWPMALSYLALGELDGGGSKILPKKTGFGTIGKTCSKEKTPTVVCRAGSP